MASKTNCTSSTSSSSGSTSGSTSGSGSNSSPSSSASSDSSSSDSELNRAADGSSSKRLEQCGLLTINQHRYALEGKPDKTKRKRKSQKSCQTTVEDGNNAAAMSTRNVTGATGRRAVAGRGGKPASLYASDKAAASCPAVAGSTAAAAGGKKSASSAARKQRSKSDSRTVSICMAHSRYTIIGVVARQLGWKCIGSHEHSNLIWTDALMGVELCRYLRRYQKINHFPSMFEICRKDLLARNMNRMLKLFPHDYAVFPKTWHLPADYGEAQRFARTHRNRTYILKPDQGAQGRGISLVRSLKSISPTDHMILQQYVMRPLLIDGFKFDLRLYALITCIDPLRVYVYNEGLVRFATSQYREPRGHNTTNMFMHLTNYSVNKYSRTYSTDMEEGSKRKFSTLNRILAAEGYDVVTLWQAIDEVVVKTVASAWPVMRHSYFASFPQHDVVHACFEILGVDVLIDQDLKPWLLEVNHSPSFHCDSQVDKAVKQALITDTFVLLNMRPEVKRRVIEQDKQRINDRLLRRPPHGEATAAGGATTTQAPTFAEQFKWEDAHMGGFRRVMPAPGDSKKYDKFFDTQTNLSASVFAETATSKKREEEARIYRAALAEREKFPVQVKTFRATMESDEQQQHGGGAATRRRHRRPPPIADGYHMQPVSELEERERCAQMAQRTFLVHSCGVVAYIYAGFYRNNMLTAAEMQRFKSMDVTQLYEDGDVAAVAAAGGAMPAAPGAVLLKHHEQRLRLKSLMVDGAGDNVSKAATNVQVVGVDREKMGG